MYYTREGAIPDDQVARLIGARSRDEREALQAVLTEFFQRTADGWVQTRCEREIERFKDGEPEREAKKANEDNRLKRHREERARLFKVLTDAGQHAPWNIGMNELRELVKRVTATAPETAPETQLPPLPATAPATPATATQTPLPNTHTPIPKEERAGTREVVPRTPGAEACIRMKAAGLQAVNPSHPKLLALLEAGITVDELAHAAGEAVAKGKGFAYALATAEGRRRDAATPALPDRASVTVPGPAGPDPTLVRLEEERAAWRPPAPEVKALLRETVARLKGASA